MRHVASSGAAGMAAAPHQSGVEVIQFYPQIKWVHLACVLAHMFGAARMHHPLGWLRGWLA